MFQKKKKEKSKKSYDNLVFIKFYKNFFEIIFAFFLSLVIVSIYGFNRDFLLNLITLCTFLNTSYWFTA